MVRITLDKPYIPVPVPITAVKYGLLYNWYAATDVRNIAAEGWEVPNKSDWDSLIGYLGGGDTAFKLRESGIVYWDSNEGTNDVLLNIRGAGKRVNVFFYGLRYFSIQGCQDIHTESGYNYFKEFDDGTNTIIDGTDMPYIGNSYRLIKTTTTLTHGQTGTYTGNDGKVYRTICIGTQEWLADNLAETKYRNGDTIPEVTDNSAWAALTTGALCAYNNDWSNVLI